MFNLIACNKLVVARQFSMMTMAQMWLHLLKGLWLAPLYLKDAYSHIPSTHMLHHFMALQVSSMTLQLSAILCLRRSEGLHEAGESGYFHAWSERY